MAKKKAGRPPKEDKKTKEDKNPETLTEKKMVETVQGLIDGKSLPYNNIEEILDRIAERYYIRIEVDPIHHIDRNGWNVYLEKQKKLND